MSSKQCLSTYLLIFCACLSTSPSINRCISNPLPYLYVYLSFFYFTERGPKTFTKTKVVLRYRSFSYWHNVQQTVPIYLFAYLVNLFTKFFIYPSLSLSLHLIICFLEGVPQKPSEKIKEVLKIFFIMPPRPANTASRRVVPRTTGPESKHVCHLHSVAIRCVCFYSAPKSLVLECVFEYWYFLSSPTSRTGWLAFSWDIPSRCVSQDVFLKRGGSTVDS